MKLPVVFFVEDSQILSSLIVGFLERNLNARIIAFKSAEEALEQWSVFQPKVLLLDYHLDMEKASNINGLEFLHRLKKLNLSVPTIMMSGQRSKRVTADVLSTSAVDYIAKTDEFFLEKLLDGLEGLLETLNLSENNVKKTQQLRDEKLRIAAYLLVPILLILLAWMVRLMN